MNRVLRHTVLGALLLSSLSGRAPAQVRLVAPPASTEIPGGSAPARRAAEQPAAAMLPDRFAGWTGAATENFGPFSASTLVAATGQAEGSYTADILVEYGFQGAERKEYSRGPQRLRVEALRFKDASGSYGLYSFHRSEDWDTRTTGAEHVASRGSQVLLRKEEVVIRATMITPTTPTTTAGAGRLGETDVRALSAAVIVSGGGPLPSLPQFHPAAGLQTKSRKYILGPAAFAQLASDWPADLADFTMGAEASLATYKVAGEPPMRMLLLSYPTPQMAAAKLRAAQPDSSLYARRRGTLLALVSGAQSKPAAEALLNRIEYQAEVMWNERVRPTWGRRERAQFMLNLFKLIGALLAFALLSGLGFGLIRVAIQSRYPNLFFDRPGETEIIQLNIRYSR